MKKINKILLTTLTTFTSTVSSANVVEAASGDKLPNWYKEAITFVNCDGVVEQSAKHIVYGNSLACSGVIKKCNYKKKTVTIEFTTVRKVPCGEGEVVTEYVSKHDGTFDSELKTFVQYNRQYYAKLKFTKIIKLSSKSKANKKLNKKEFNKKFKKGTKIGRVIINFSQSNSGNSPTLKKRLETATYKLMFLRNYKFVGC